jgi:His-Xaa-Ser system radical SAM maturase HxsB
MHSVTLTQPELEADSLGFFRWGRVAGQVLVTTDAGDWTFLSDAEFADLLAGRVADGHPRFVELQRKGLLRDGLDLDALAARVAQRNRHVRRGAYVHVVTLTTRRPGAANGQAADAGIDMSRETAEQVVELALQTMSPALTLELQADGGEPLLNYEVLTHLVELALTRNKRSTGKALTIRLLSNFAAMTEERAEWLIANGVHVVTTLDGPAALHDANRAWKPGSAHADVVRWLEYFARRYAELKRDPDWHVDALVTVTRQTLPAWRAVVDEYIARGLRAVHFQPLLASRLGRDAWQANGYGIDEYLAFYRQALAYVLERNRAGADLTERSAAIILTKILTTDDAGAVDIQSPFGGGTAQVAYHVDGGVFPDDDARQVDALGDPLFALGQVDQLALSELVRHPTVRAIAAASLLDAQPMCADCWNKPYCGFSPVQSYLTQGDLFGQRPHCLQCKEHMAVSTALFERLTDDADAETRAVLERWAAVGQRPAGDGRASKTPP